MEEKIKTILEKCMQPHKPNETSQILSKFQAECRNLLENEIDNIGMSKAQKDAAILLCQYCSFPIKWELTAKLTVISSQGEEITIGISCSIHIQESAEEINELIKKYIEQIRIIALDGNMLLTSPSAILRWAQESFKKIHNGSSNAEIKKMFANMLEDNFGAKFVEFGSIYNSDKFFDFFESTTVEAPITTVPAVIMQFNNSCILKGKYIMPIQNIL